MKKGAKVMMFAAELMRDRIIRLERANEAASTRKQCNKTRLDEH